MLATVGAGLQTRGRRGVTVGEIAAKWRRKQKPSELVRYLESRIEAELAYQRFVVSIGDLARLAKRLLEAHLADEESCRERRGV